MKRFSIAVVFLAIAGSAWAGDPKVVARVGRIYIDEQSVGGLSAHESRLEKQSDGSLKGRGGDQLVSSKGDSVEVKLGAYKGVFTVKSVNDVRTIDGEWGTGFPSHPVHIELAADHVFMKWGFYERTLKPIDAPQLDASCRRFARDDGGVAGRWIDVMDLCGDAISTKVPSQELVTALLMNGFKKDRYAVAGPVPLATSETPALHR
ncbi:MAG: hypothetical protein QM723_29075 [Myxococcaceae bacterium]